MLFLLFILVVSFIPGSSPRGLNEITAVKVLSAQLVYFVPGIVLGVAGGIKQTREGSTPMAF